jgi:hypothetical protein
LYLPPGKYEYKFSRKQKWLLEEGKAVEGTNHFFEIHDSRAPRSFYRNLEVIRQYINQQADRFFPFREYHVYNIGDIVVIKREPNNHLESICIIANVSQKAS